MKLGVFGGSFDPIHFGHLLLAETCREHCGLDEVAFVPAFVSPHKTNDLPTDAKHRVEMVKLAIGGHPSFSVSTTEVARESVSYTVETLEELKKQDASRELFFIMGADSLVDFPSWKSPARICELATIIAVGRADSSLPTVKELTTRIGVDVRVEFVPFPLVELSSSEIRERVLEERSIRYRTPRAVEKYIEANRLYMASNK